MSLTADLGQPIASTSEERQIAIRLSTKDAAYTIPPAKFLVPASWRRFQLSELINKVLENDSPVPFDFLIDQTLLRSSLGAYCQATNISEEIVLDVEFLPSTLPPQLDQSLPAEDWVSDVDVSVPGAILTASYAGTSSLQTTGASSPLTFAGHDLSVLSTTYIHQSIDDKKWIASGGMDRLARVWEYETPALSLTDMDMTPVAPKSIYTLSLHQAPVSSVRSRPAAAASSSSAPHLLTAGWDGLIGVWDLTPGVNEGEADHATFERTKKKRRKGTDQTLVKNKLPAAVLRGHTNKVSRAIFDRSDENTAYSAGWDHSVRVWDLQHGIEKENKASDKVHLDLCQLATPSLLLTGSTDRLLSLFDLRHSTLSSISLSLSGHTGPVSSVAAHPTNPLMFVSGSYDSTVRVWDARSPKQSLFTLDMPQKEQESPQDGSKKDKDKILCVDWDGDRIVAGGEGAKVAVWKISGKEENVIAAEAN